MISNNIVTPTTEKSIEITKRKWIRANIACLFSMKIKNREKVKKSQVLGHIMDTYGETKFDVKSPNDRYIIAVNNFPIINVDDALFKKRMI